MRGLDSGADAFLTKPYSFEALEAHLRALLRRATPTQREVLRFQDLTLNLTDPPRLMRIVSSESGPDPNSGFSNFSCVTRGRFSHERCF